MSNLMFFERKMKYSERKIITFGIASDGLGGIFMKEQF